jgi:hypothetical protein
MGSATASQQHHHADDEREGDNDPGPEAGSEDAADDLTTGGGQPQEQDGREAKPYRPHRWSWRFRRAMARGGADSRLRPESKRSGGGE